MVERFKAIQARHGPESVAFLSTGHMPTEEMALLGALARFGMGMAHGEGNIRQCMATSVVACKQAFGFVRRRAAPRRGRRVTCTARGWFPPSATQSGKQQGTQEERVDGHAHAHSEDQGQDGDPPMEPGKIADQLDAGSDEGDEARQGQDAQRNARQHREPAFVTAAVLREADQPQQEDEPWA